jgi:hypothetical protein
MFGDLPIIKEDAAAPGSFGFPYRIPISELSPTMKR